MSPSPVGPEHLVFPPELVRFLTGSAGMRRAFRVLEFLMLWGILADELDREPTSGEFCERWDESPATYYRRLEGLRAVWPEDKNPQRLWEWRRTQLPAPASSRKLAT